MKVALVYDRVNKFGGAERVLRGLHEIWPNAPLYTSVYDPALAQWANVFEVRTSFLQKLPLPKNKHELYPFLMGIAFESFNFDEYDVVISVTHEFAKAIITKPNTLHVCYCLTPTGYLWSGQDQYFLSKPNWFRQVTRPVIKYLRWYDKIVAQRPDTYIAVSQTIHDRIKKYYGRESNVIYPPVNISANTKTANGDYFLIVSRLVPQKRVDIAIDAFNQLQLPLKIIGTGSEEKRLRSKARDNIKFLGYLSDNERDNNYSQCRAVIICGEEDFNIVAVETQSFGKPVIAFKAGGVTETIIDGKTGWFFPSQTKNSLVETLQKINSATIDPQTCRQNAQRFSAEKFGNNIRNYIKKSFCDYVQQT